MQRVLATAAVFSLGSLAFAGDALDIKGGFAAVLKSGLPEGWTPNDGIWDASVQISVTNNPGTEKYVLQMTSKTNAMHLRTSPPKMWAVDAGDTCIVRAMVKGQGAGGSGIYAYPGKLFMIKSFTATSEWKEFAANVKIPSGYSNVVVVITASRGASVSFMDVTAEIVKAAK